MKSNAASDPCNQSLCKSYIILRTSLGRQTTFRKKESTTAWWRTMNLTVLQSKNPRPINAKYFYWRGWSKIPAEEKVFSYKCFLSYKLENDERSPLCESFIIPV